MAEDVPLEDWNISAMNSSFSIDDFYGELDTYWMSKVNLYHY